MKLLSRIKNTVAPTLKDGKKPKARIMLYGFFGNNFGDDVFFDIILRRYPDVLFYVFFKAEYEQFFADYNNVRYYSYSRPLVDRVNRFGGKFGNGMLFEEILLHLCDGAVHIGGSVYQEIGDWRLDLDIRKKRHRHSKRFYGISNNFGPYKSEDFRTDWEKELRRFKGISFRDRYSFDLFPELKNSVYAPDLLFSLTPPDIEEEKNSVAISVINPRPGFRGMAASVQDGYISSLTGLTALLASGGYNVSLVGFCGLEDDTGAINEIYDGLPRECRANVSLRPYTNRFQDTLDILAGCEYIVSTRFHSSVVGYAFNKKVLPISYNSKVANMLRDIGVTDFIDIEEISEYPPERLFEMLRCRESIDVSSAAGKTKKHFAALDKILKPTGEQL